MGDGDKGTKETKPQLTLEVIFLQQEHSPDLMKLKKNLIELLLPEELRLDWPELWRPSWQKTFC